jgi:hypothetical protein
VKDLPVRWPSEMLGHFFWAEEFRPLFRNLPQAERNLPAAASWGGLKGRTGWLSP